MIRLDQIFCPLELGKLLWPDVFLWSRQREAVLSLKEAVEVDMPACKEIGKDFAAAFMALTFWIRPQCYFPQEHVRAVEKQRKPGWNPHSRRIVTTSIKDEHLDVLWGEIARFYVTSRFPLDAKHGGPFIMNHHEIRFKEEGGTDVKNPLSYLRGQVTKPDSVESMSGHHAAYTLFIGDEASGLQDSVHKGAQGWAKKFFYPGNTNPCRNFWFRHCKEGDRRDPDTGKLVRKVINVRAEESPNVAYALKQESLGMSVTNEVLVPGVLSLDRYRWKRTNLRPLEQEIDLEAKFPSDAKVLLFPDVWLKWSEAKAERIKGMKRVARAMGIDPAEGGDRTAFCVIDEHGVIELISFKTPDTSDTFDHAMALMRRWNVPPDRICFDVACGKAHADRMRRMGFKVRTVHFGESIQQEIKHGLTPIKDRREVREDKGLYKNRRAEMYHELSQACNPQESRGGFALASSLRSVPRADFNIFDQLEPILFMFDKESGDGKLMLPPKQEMIATLYDGRGSPDEADALALAFHAMTHKGVQSKAGAA